MGTDEQPRVPEPESAAPPEPWPQGGPFEARILGPIPAVPRVDVPVAVVPLSPAEVLQPPPLPAGFGAPPSPVSTDLATPPISGPKFCQRCGGLWDPSSGGCPACVVRATTPRPALMPDAGGKSIGSAVALYFSLLVASVVGLICTMNDVSAVAVDFGVTIAHTLVVLAWCLVAWRDVFPPLAVRSGLGWYATALGGACVTFGLAWAAIEALHRGLKVPQLEYAEPFLKAGYGWGTVVLLVCVQPAVIEELAFRGVIFSALRRPLSSAETIFVSALMFMILHLSVPSFPHLFAIGLALGYLRTRTKSLYPGMLLHFTHNLLCVASEWAFH